MADICAKKVLPISFLPVFYTVVTLEAEKSLTQVTTLKRQVKYMYLSFV